MRAYRVRARAGVIVDTFHVDAFSIYDCKADVFSQVLFFRNEAEARRAFANSVNSQDSHMYFNPEDFTLFKVGSFSYPDGVLVGIDKVAICTGVQCKVQES